MASDVDDHAQYVKHKGKGPAQVAETAPEQQPPLEIPSPEICVICLDRISEKATALPCKHDQFDFPCLGTWIQQSEVCPLCKSEVKAIEYHVAQEENGSKIFYLPAKEIPKRRSIQNINRLRAQAQRYHPYSRRSRGGRTQRDWGEQSCYTNKEDQALEFRRKVYQKKMFSAYVGTNRISQYRNITPQSFLTNANLVNRAKTFIRRELQVFDFLNPSSTSFGVRGDRRASNAEFLLEYIIGILKSIDLKGSGGQAGELLNEFLGRENTNLFLHELEAWLRSPYERLSDWDRHVQYSNVAEVEGGSSVFA